MNKSSKRKGVVFIPVEVQKRELMGKIYLASRLADSGYEVLLGEYYQILNCAKRFENGIFIDKAFFMSDAQYLRELKHRGFYLLAWDEEGLVTGPYEMYKNRRLGKETLLLLDDILCWGDVQAEYITRFMPEVKSKISIVGNPRMDLLRDDFRTMYQKKIEEIKKQYGEFILVNTNFVGAMGKDIENLSVATIKAQAEAPEAALAELKSRVKLAREIHPLFLEGIRFMASNVEYKIVVRPHPAEDIDFYKRYFDDMENVEVVRKWDVAPWIISSVGVVHNSCTTSIEALMAKKPTIAFLPNGLELHHDEMNSASFIVRDGNSLVTAVKNIHDNIFVNSNSKKISRLCNIGDASSADMVVALLDERQLPNSPGIQLSWKKKIKNLCCDYYFAFKQNNNLLTKYKYPHITLGQLKKTFSVLGKALKINRFDKDVFYIVKSQT